ncbi:MAG: ribonuclease H-like domain-containing protein, partial [Spirochaetaceae bacterium]|nr:ribonuclease H-like domain-containing protein [Spirochaetaceae bacterium]
MNLSGRLQRIREFNRPARAEKQACGQQPREEQTPVRKIGGAKTLPAPLADSSFKEEGYFTLRRKLAVNLPVPLRARFPKTLAALAPALADAGLTADDLIFFDLETTGLSGGAGTVAFLAAFGRFSGGNYGAIDVDQYLLLDHAGEEDFLRLIEPHFSPLSQDRPAVIVSYNGKSFDSQVIRSRFLFNGMPSPPIDRHADLLYAARCLWKRKLPSCSQSEIERSVLGIDRGDDIPGSRAPDIWFSFLKTNDAAELAGVCRHNLLDIA